MANSSNFVAVMAELHAALGPGDLAQRVRRVTDAAVELLPDVDGATITIEHEGGAYETAAATRAQMDGGGSTEPGQAPAVTSSDLSRDGGYPSYGEVAANAGVRAQVTVLLFDTDHTRGLLNLYSLRSGAFDDTAALTDRFARHSATALAYAAEYEDRETTTAERRAVGQVLGIVMERYTLSEAQAYALLQQTAEHREVSVRLVAQELVTADQAGSEK